MSLICQNCKDAKATVHITDTLPEKRERHLCDACAQKEGIIQKHNHQTTNEILAQFIKHKAGMDTTQADATCDKCGLSFREFHGKGVLGCPNDYTAFRKLLSPLIQRAHEGATHHIGKVPKSAGSDAERQAGLIRLRRELQEAVDKENYELAARVRDQIQALEPSKSDDA